MKYRQAVYKDIPQLAKVHVDSWQTTYDGIVPQSFLYETLTYDSLEKRWEMILAHHQAIVAENEEGSVIGFASGGIERSGKYDYEGELYAIYLLKTYQGKGIGKKLVQMIAEQLFREQMHSMLVWVLKDNDSKYFYESLGGKYVDTEIINIGGKKLTEIAYGWDSIQPLLPVKE